MNMGFSRALIFLKMGAKLQRAAWKTWAPGCYIQLGSNPQMILVKVESTDGGVTRPDPMWQCDHDDILAEDWTIYG